MSDEVVYTIKLLEKQVKLLTALLEKSTEQNAMFHAFIQHQTAHARVSNQWKQENPEDSKRYGEATQRLQKLVFKYFNDMSEDLETLEENDFTEYEVSEFVMKYGASIAQMQAALQTLSNLGTQ